MKQIVKSFLIPLPVIFLVMLMVFQPTFAQTDNNNSSTVVLPKGEVVDHNYYASGNSITLSGTVNGDAYLAGGNIVVDGTVNGDLLVIGGIVDIRGTVTNDIRAVGGQVTSSGSVGRNISILSGSANLTDTASIAGSLTGAGSNFSIFAPIGKSVDVSATQVIIGSTIDDNVNINASQVTLTPSANIGGNFTYLSNNKAQIEEGAQIGGTTTQNFPPQKAPSPEPLAFLAGLSLVTKIISFIAALIFGLLMIRFVPVFTQNAVNTINESPWVSLGIGFVTVVLFPVVFIILLIILIGIPIALILLAVFLIFLYLAKIFASLWIGGKLLGMIGLEVSLGWALFIGLLIYVLLSLIPIIGWFITAVAVLIGFGALIIERRKGYLELRDKKLI